jgi:hypothetical protein
VLIPDDAAAIDEAALLGALGRQNLLKPRSPGVGTNDLT